MKRATIFLIPMVIAGTCLLNACGGVSRATQQLATHFGITAPAAVAVGQPLSAVVTALDASGNTVVAYAGAVSLATSDPQAKISPTAQQLVNGTGTFSVTFQKTGTQTISATDTLTASISGTRPLNVNPPLSINSGSPGNFTVGVDYATTTGTQYFSCAWSPVLGWHLSCVPCNPSQLGSCPGVRCPSHIGVKCVETKTTVQGFIFTATGGVPGYAWNASSMPPGLTIGSESGQVLGTPTSAGSYTIAVNVSDSETPPVQTSVTYSVNVNALSTSSASPASADAAATPRVWHHHYKLIDLGTFGGPNSYFDTLLVTDGFNYGTAFYNNARVWNGQGNFVGFADTPTSDPYSADPLFCYVPECFTAHAFEWRDGNKVDLGTLPGGASSAAFWINSKGLITGNSENGELDPVIPGLPELRAVIWKDGKIRDLGTLGGSSSFSQAVNDRGQVTGLALNGIPDPFSFYYQYLFCLPFQICPADATETRGFIWDEKDGMQDIGTLGGPDAFPSLINNRGQIAGFSYTDSIPQPTTGFPTAHPFLWEKGKGMKDLGSFGGSITASVNGLNERGEVVGGSFLAGDVNFDPFLWDGDKLIDLLAPPFSGGGEANWINEAGEAVGIAVLPAQCPGSQTDMVHAFLWRGGTITDLGSVSGTSLSRADFINSQSQVVGGSWACDNSVFDGFLWENGSMVDLNELVPANSALHIVWAPFINDEGVIGVFANTSNGDLHAALLIPCDENHPDVEGCDYSMVDGSAIAKDAALNVTAQPQQNVKPMLPPEIIRRLMRRSVSRSVPWFRRSTP